MQKQKLEVFTSREILKSLEDAFTVIPIVPRDCVKALNILAYNLNKQDFPPEVYKNILFLILRAFTSKDSYLKSLIYSLLEKLSAKTGDGVLGINSILKDIDDKNATVSMKNSAYRALFTNLPASMKFDFEKLIKTALLDRKFRDNTVCIASEYFKEIKIDPKMYETIEDYHLSFFNRLPVNKYSSMLEVKRISKNSSEFNKISSFLSASTDSITFFEAAKALVNARLELAAPFVDKAVSTMRIYLTKSDIGKFASMKILSKLSVNFPQKVAKANREIEDLVQHTSKTISMLAILTLLKTGTDETAKQLSAKLEPLMSTMSESYKIMAVDTIEKLTKRSKTEYISFLEMSLFDRGSSIDFKRFILKKLESLLSFEEARKPIIKFLCRYIEDPEYYQVSMDILGIFGQHIHNSKDLIHVYNRIILDNGHVRNCAYQTLFDLDERLQTIESLKNVCDPDTERIRTFLYSNSSLKRGEFDLNELGDLRDDVMKYLKKEDVSAVEEAQSTGMMKECRPIQLTEAGSDFDISVVKKISDENVVLTFTFTNNMPKVIVNSCILAIGVGSEKYYVKLSQDDFKAGTTVSKDTELPLHEGDVINSTFEYQISLEDDLDETETDNISLIPFDINILDFVRPASVESTPGNMKEISLKFKMKSVDSISKIVGVCNMLLIADRDSFELQGMYKDIPVVIKGEASFSKYTTVNMKIYSGDSSLVDKIAAVFD